MRGRLGPTKCIVKDEVDDVCGDELLECSLLLDEIDFEWIL